MLPERERHRESSGTLKLTREAPDGERLRQPIPNGGGSYYFTSGMITTRGQDAPLRQKYRQGYLEVQMRVPRGNIYWAALWLADPLDGSSPGWPDYGEIDASEIYGARPDVTESNFWRAGGDIGAGDHNVNNPPSSDDRRQHQPTERLRGRRHDELAPVRDQLDREQAAVVRRRGPGPHLQRLDERGSRWRWATRRASS